MDIDDKKISQNFRQFVIYGIIGITINFISYLIYLFLVYWYMPPKVAMTILYAVGMLTSFFVNRRVTFIDNRGLKKSSWRFVFTYGCGYLINLLFLFLLVDKMEFFHEIIQAIAIFVVAGFLFLMNKYFVFKDF